MASDPLHVVAFPWLAFGHMLPFLELSKSLAERGHRVSFISTPRNIQRLPQIPATLSTFFDFIPFPLPDIDGLLPPNAESTADIPPDQVPYLKKAFDGLKLPFADFLKKNNKPTWIIVDFAHYWLPPIAAEFGVPCTYFSVFLASSLAFFGSSSVLLDGNQKQRTVEGYTAPPEWIPSSLGSSIAYRLHEARWVAEAHSENASGVSDAHRLGAVIDGCKLVAVRTVTELESDWLRLLTESIYKKPVVPVGLLPPAPQHACASAADARALIEWLDAQSPGTVVYVAFGSEAVIASDELAQELALGLELSNVPFLWACRQPSNLPEGFEDRVRGRGLVAAGWVPQLELLGHRSVGAFFTHSGASSVFEGLRFGHPLIMLPLMADQGLIARTMVEKKVGVEVPRDEQDGSFTREGVAEVVKMVMLEEQGKTFVAKAEEMSTEIFAVDGTSRRHMDHFVSCLRNCVKE